MVAPAAAGLQRYLADLEFRPLTRRVLSTVTGGALPADADLGELLVRQVRFVEVNRQASRELGVQWNQVSNHSVANVGDQYADHHALTLSGRSSAG